jgi:eukaryotic-like serine/threonine-protein kinase
MSEPTDPSRDLLFGLLALQTGMIDQGALFTAFAAWTRDKSRTLADHLVALGHLDAPRRAAVEAIAGVHVQALGGDIEKSLAVLAVGRSTRGSLALAGGPDVTATLGHVGSAHPSTHDDDNDPDRTGSLSVGSATSEGQRFRIVRPHARGGLGAVFVALDSELDREVALKQILDDRADDPTSRIRFLIEAQITGGLEHPGIVPVYGLGADGDGRPYYAMRFIRGDSLKEAIDHFHAGTKAGPGAAGPIGSRDLALRKLLRRFMDVCNAIDYAHSRGVIHRDIKPANIIVGKHGETLVVDWGLAKPMGRVEPGTESGERMLTPSSASGSAETLPGSAMGTPAYMSPEQAEGQLDRLAPRSDVYSLGATLYCLLTGKPPFAGDVVDVIRAVQRGEFRPPRQLDPNIDRALEAICLKAMAHRPEDRYASSRALADDLDRWMADEPVTARREPLSARVARWARRHRSGVTAAATALVLVAVVASVAALLIDQSLRKERLALAAETQARADANRRLKQARESIDTLLTGVGEGLAKVPGAQKVRKQLLEKAASQYRQLADEKGDDSAIRYESGSALARLGRIRFLLGDYPGAEANLRAAEATLAALPAPSPSSGGPEGEMSLAQVRGKLASALRQQGRLVEAEAAYRRAIDAGRVGVDTNPDDWKARYSLGAARADLAGMLNQSKRNDETEALFRAAIDDLDAAAQSERYEPRNILANCQNGFGLFLQKVGRVAEAEAQFRAAIATGSGNVKAFSDEFDARSDLAIAQRNLASLLEDQGRWAEAEDLFRTSLAEREALARANPEVPQYLLFRGSGRRSLAEFFRKRARYKEAEDLTRQGVEDFETLARAHPAVPEYAYRAASTRSNLAWILMDLARFPEAEAQARAGTEALRRLWDAHPTVLVYGDNLGNGFNDLARILRRMGRFVDAEKAYRDGIDVFERLVKEDPSVPRYPDLLALLNNNLALLYATRQRYPDSLPLARRSVAVYEDLVKLHPKVVDYSEGLVMSRETLAQTLEALGSGEEAREVVAAAIDLCRRLVEFHPEIPVLSLRLMQSYRLKAQVDGHHGRFDEALKALDSSSRLLRRMTEAHPDSAVYRGEAWDDAIARAELDLARGQADEAADALEQVAKQPGGGIDSCYNAACMFAKAAVLASKTPPGPGSHPRSRSYQGRAVDLLRRAVAMGFRELTQLAKDPDLDVLRDRPDFQLLIMDLAFPAQPFAR